MEVIPAIDLMDGKVVRLTEGDFSKKEVYPMDPLELSLLYERMGFKRLHVVDLDGARSGEMVNKDIVEEICAATSLRVDYGGGIRENKQIEKAFQLGIEQVTVGSIAIKNPKMLKQWMKDFGADKFIIAADSKNGKISTGGWLESSTKDLMEFVGEWQKEGINWFLCTDISKDGKMEGPNFSMYEELLRLYPTIRLIASGGVSSEHDLERLNEIGLPYTVVGKAIYQGVLELSKISELYISN